MTHDETKMWNDANKIAELLHQFLNLYEYKIELPYRLTLSDALKSIESIRDYLDKE